jgi:hypothetical protein
MTWENSFADGSTSWNWEHTKVLKYSDRDFDIYQIRPGSYSWPLLATMLLGYSLLTHLVKVWFVRRWGL